MKNTKKLLKVIGIMFLVYVVLSWIIPGGSFSNGAYTKDATHALGLADIIMYPIATLLSSNFLVIGLIVLMIGGLYGVMNKTGVYSVLVDKVVKKVENKKTAFLVGTILLFAILSSLTTLSLPLFALIPFFITVILLLGYDKITALLSTVGAILVGIIGTTFGYNMDGYNYFNILFETKITDIMQVKVVLFIAVVAVLIFHVVKSSKSVAAKEVKKTTKKTTKTTKAKEVKEEKKEESYLLYSKEVKTKKGILPLCIIAILTFVIVMVGMYGWGVTTNTTIFTKFHESVTTFALNGYTLFANILGTSNPYLAWSIGNWGNYDFLVILVIATIVIGLVYRLSVKDFIDGLLSGMKEILPVAFMAVIANLLYLTVSMTTNYVGTSFLPTIANVFLSNSHLGYFSVMISTIIGAPFYNELPYLALALQDPLKTLFDNVTIIPVIIHSFFGLMMMILPTSVLLAAGLTYTDVSLKDYFKSSWKLLLGLFAVIVIVLVAFMYIPGIKVI